MVGVDLGHGVDRVLGDAVAHALGQGGAVEGHAFLGAFGEQRTRLQEEQLVVEVAEALLGFDLQLDARTGLMALQGGLDHVEEVVAAHHEFHRLVEHVQHIAERVFHGPGQADHALFRDFHCRILPWRSINRCRCSAA
ncbi:hypothetical protein D3C78_1598060 [compost metagenome]